MDWNDVSGSRRFYGSGASNAVVRECTGILNTWRIECMPSRQHSTPHSVREPLQSQTSAKLWTIPTRLIVDQITQTTHESWTRGDKLSIGSLGFIVELLFIYSIYFQKSSHFKVLLRRASSVTTHTCSMRLIPLFLYHKTVVQFPRCFNYKVSVQNRRIQSCSMRLIPLFLYHKDGSSIFPLLQS